MELERAEKIKHLKEKYDRINRLLKILEDKKKNTFNGIEGIITDNQVKLKVWDDPDIGLQFKKMAIKFLHNILDDIKKEIDKE